MCQWISFISYSGVAYITVTITTALQLMWSEFLHSSNQWVGLCLIIFCVFKQWLTRMWYFKVVMFHCTIPSLLLLPFRTSKLHKAYSQILKQPLPLPEKTWKYEIYFFVAVVRIVGTTFYSFLACLRLSFVIKLEKMQFLTLYVLLSIQQQLIL